MVRIPGHVNVEDSFGSLAVREAGPGNSGDGRALSKESIEVNRFAAGLWESNGSEALAQHGIQAGTTPLRTDPGAKALACR